MQLVSDFARSHEAYATFNDLLERYMTVLWFSGMQVAGAREGRLEGIKDTMLRCLDTIAELHEAVDKKLPRAFAGVKQGGAARGP